MSKKILQIVCLLCLSIVVMADDDIISLPEMTIYNKEISSEFTASQMQNELTRDDLESAEMPDLNNVLRNQTGLMLNQGSGQMPTAIHIRGAGGVGQGMVTLDGVPLFGNFAGMYSLSHYPLDAFDQVTITRGASGEKHGSRTLGGTIHLQTRRMQEKDNFLHVEGGSYDTVRSAIGSGLTTAAGDFSAVVGRSDIFSGISQAQNGTEGDNFGMTHASANWFKNFGRGRLDASLYFVRSDENTDGPGLVPARRVVGWVDDKYGKLSDETWVTQLHGEYDLAAYWKSSLQLGFTQDRQKMVTTAVKPFSISNQLFMVDWKNTHRLPLDENNKNQALLVWGVNTQHQQTLNMPASQTVISPNVRGELVMGEWKWSADGRFDNGDTYGNHQVFSLGLNRSLPQNVNVFANGGTGYRQPGVSELMNPLFGNRALLGESNAGGEVGISWNPLPDSEIKISGYHQNYQQMIVLMSDARTGVLKAQNVQDVDVWGSEMQSRHRWSSIWESGLNYSYMNAINSITHLHVSSRPEHQGVFWNEVQLSQPLTLRVELNVHGSYWFNAANTLRANTAPRVNALLKYQLTKKTELYVRGENVTNERTPELLDFNFNGAAIYAGFRTGF
jgi:outer membrane cobalamin receptor